MGKEKILITGASGFFGSILKKRMLEKGFYCINIDLIKDKDVHPNLISIQGDIRDIPTLEAVFKKNKIKCIFHCAAILAHAVKDKNFLWESNVDGTKNIAEMAKKYKVKRIIFTSSNCLWAENFHRPVKENDLPKPTEIYGMSKWEGEKILLSYKKYIDSIIIRCPTIIDAGRLGLLSILFEFIDEGRKVWVVGGGKNVYQFIYAEDLIDAFIKSMNYKGAGIFNIGSDNVKSFKDIYNYIIKKAKTKARVASLPKRLTIILMKIAYFFKMSPLGPYQYKMIAEDFVFDTSKIKKELKWKPSLTNEEMLWKAYKYYHDNLNEIKNRKGVSAHSQSVKMGIIKLLKWMS